jgi:raffinose/stachyose/melibiose transport system permease protein
MLRALGLIVLIGLAIIITAPTLLTVFASVRPIAEQGGSAWLPPLNPTIDHFIRVWTEGGFSRYFFNSLLISTIDAVVMIVIASMLAYALHFMEFRGKLVINLVLLFGLMIPVTAIVLPLYSTVRSVGLINTHLGVILSDLALALPIFVFLFVSYFKSIPKALHEAARIDGASG